VALVDTRGHWAAGALDLIFQIFGLRKNFKPNFSVVVDHNFFGLKFFLSQKIWKIKSKALAAQWPLVSLRTTVFIRKKILKLNIRRVTLASKYTAISVLP
jgi:hypothetical protein